MSHQLALTDSTAGRARAHRDLLSRYHLDGDLGARAQLAEQLLPLARSLAARYRNGGEPYDDLVQVACLGLMNAIDRFDLSRPVAFSSYATPTILGEIKRHFRDRTWAVRPPRSLQEAQTRIARTRDDLANELGREPTIAELADAVDSCQEEVSAAILAYRARHARSMSEPTGDDSTLGDSLGGSDPALSRAETGALLAGAISVLSARERTILRLRFEEDLTQQEIAKTVGISQMQVSRLIRRSIDRLRIEIETTPRLN